MKVAANLAILVALYVVGTLLFTGGFLLRRIVVESNSTCTKGGSSSGDLDHCTVEARHKRAVVIVVDALRYDFVTYNYSDGFIELPFQNKFRKLAAIINERPAKSRLYRFVADPPTTTLQRLKGLTTGSLPTFVDAGENFAKTEISEDNFIDQLRSFNRSIVFTGDDTWVGLYPGRFLKSFPYPSFNVKDLHTVDNGVIGHLVPELANKEWDLLIGHLLGVDHCGHTFGPYHSAMSEKLTQIDDFIESVIQSLDNDTILFVLGDHGMTKTGDHGGDSNDEVEAALFVYSNKGFGSSQKISEEGTTILQIDFVASISLLLGLPIPFQNLGIVISDLFRFCQNDDCKNEEIEKELTLLQALHLNANQVHKYVETYAALSAGFDVEDVRNFNEIFQKADFKYRNVTKYKDIRGLDPSHLRNVQSDYERYLVSVRSFLQKKWAQFDMPMMFYSMAILVAAVLLNFYLIFTEDYFSLTASSFAVVMSFVASVCLLFYGLCLLSVLSFLTGILLFVVLILNKFLRRTASFESSSSVVNIRDAISIVIWLVYIVSLLSNSFVVYEGSVASFLLQTCLYVQFICIAHDYSTSSLSWSKTSKKCSPDSKPSIRGHIFLLMFFSLAANFLLSVSSTFRTCREEQTNCTESWLLQQSTSEDEMIANKKKQFLLSMLAIFVVVIAVYQWLRKNGNANGWSPATVAFKYIASFSFLLVLAYWCLKTGSKSSLKQLTSLALPVAKLVYLSVFISLIMIVARPLCTFVVKHVPPTTRENLNSAILNNVLLSGSSSKDVVPQIFRQLQASWMLGRTSGQQSEENEPKIFVYGLATIFSSPLLALLLIVMILLVMLLDVSVAPSMFLLCAVSFIILECHSLNLRIESRLAFDYVPISSIILLLLLSCERFYSLGHHATITSIRWEAAYHGFEGDFHTNFIPALLIGLNTFASQIVISLALPLLVYWPFTRGGKNMHLGNDNLVSNGGCDAVKGEFLICEEDKKSLMSQLCLKAMLLCALKLLGMMVCVTLHRRHLMVWKIFAPRFIYETVAFFITLGISIFNYLFFLRTFRAADNFVSNLN